MARYMLDTDTASYVIRGRFPKLEARLREHDPATLCVSAVTRAELRYGVARLASALGLAGQLQLFLDGIFSEPWDDSAADRYGSLRAQLERRGTPIGNLDTMVAAHALALGAVLVTNNERQFRLVAGLAVENWHEGDCG